MTTHSGTLEPVPNDLPEPMKRITCSCGWKSIGVLTGDLQEKFEAHAAAAERDPCVFAQTPRNDGRCASCGQMWEHANHNPHGR